MSMVNMMNLITLMILTLALTLMTNLKMNLTRLSPADLRSPRCV